MKKKSVAAYIDLIVCSVVVVIGFIGAKIVLFDLLDGTFYKEFNEIAIAMVGIFILSIVVFIVLMELIHVHQKRFKNE